MLKLRQRDLSAVQDCSAAFSFITFRREWHEQLITHNAVGVCVVLGCQGMHNILCRSRLVVCTGMCWVVRFPHYWR